MTMSQQQATAAPRKQMNVFDRYLTVWVGICLLLGVLIGQLIPDSVADLRSLQLSGINLPIAVLIWLMIYPMMLKVDFASVIGVGRNPKGVLITVFVNWLVKPFSMAFLGWLFFKHLFLPWIGADAADQYIAGTIILAAAPCTAMVFVWSYLTDGDPGYTLVQVAINDLIMLVAFAPIVTWLVTGTSNLTVPFDLLLYSVLIFIVIPWHLDTDLRFSSRQSHRSLVSRPLDLSTHHYPGLFQRGFGLRADEMGGRAIRHCGSWRFNWSQQLL